MWDYAAVLLLLAPFDASPCLPDDAPAALAGLRRVCDLAEITDEHDTWRPDYAAEIHWARWAWQELQGCPPVSLAAALPDADVCKARYTFAYARLRALEDAAAMAPHRADGFSPWIADQRWRADSWWWAHAVHTATQVRGKRQALRKTWELCGGELPAHVCLCGYRGMP